MPLWLPRCAGALLAAALTGSVAQAADQQAAIAALAERLGALENATQTLLELVPLGMMLPYFGNELPPGERFVWADGQTGWPDEPWVHTDLRGKPVPDMRGVLIGGAPDRKRLEPSAWTGGQIELAGLTVSSQGLQVEWGSIMTIDIIYPKLLKLAQQDCDTRIVGGPMGSTSSETTCGPEMFTELPTDATPLPTKDIRGHAMTEPRDTSPGAKSSHRTNAFRSEPARAQVLTSLQPEITGSATVDPKTVDVGVDQSPPHIRTNWIIRIR